MGNVKGRKALTLLHPTVPKVPKDMRNLTPGGTTPCHTLWRNETESDTRKKSI